DGRRRLGVDGERLPSLPGFHRLPLPGILRGVPRRRVQGAPRRLMGGSPQRRPGQLPQLGLPDPPADLRRLPRRRWRKALVTVSLAPLTLAVHAVGRSARDELIADVRAGLGSNPKTMSPRWFYDERGSQLFDRITQLPEYYQTRAEAEILRAAAAEIAGAVEAENLVELGAGSCTKTRILLDAM